MEETFPVKGILEKLTRERKSLAFHTTVIKGWNPKQVITLKHLIVYNNLRVYINLKKTQIGNMSGVALNWIKYSLGYVLIFKVEKYLHTTYNSLSIFYYLSMFIIY
jgi:hypothetical protein